jgi:hypothetical protein
MSSPVSRKVKVLEASYVEDVESILILGECEEGKLRTQIHKNSFDFGSRTLSEINYEMHKTASLMEGKTLQLLFNDTIEDYNGLIEPSSRGKRVEDNLEVFARSLGL